MGYRLEIAYWPYGIDWSGCFAKKRFYPFKFFVLQIFKNGVAGYRAVAPLQQTR